MMKVFSGGLEGLVLKDTNVSLHCGFSVVTLYNVMFTGQMLSDISMHFHVDYIVL